MSGLLIAGTTSDAGKSLVTTGLARAFANRGIAVAPFKAQNMSNNSMVVPGPQGYGEIGRAQWLQAVAAKVVPETAMNPVLLKPGSDRRSHVVLHGKPAGVLDAHEFAGGREALREAAWAAYDDLAARFDVVLCEGAGSPAEINLRATDYVNMGLAQHASLPTVIVGDIDKGGVFAAMFGSVAMLSPSDQALVSGFVINKFRGDPVLLQPGIDLLEAATGRRSYGVLPWLTDVWLDSEDAASFQNRPSPQSGTASPTSAEPRVRVAVVKFPRISNFTDVDALSIERELEVWFTSGPAGLADADVVVLPGTRATMADLAWFRARGLDGALRTHVARGGHVLGICGGFQMLGELVSDPHRVEGPTAQTPGLGMLPIRTQFEATKRLNLPRVGYEIHHGRIERTARVAEYLGGAHVGNVRGTMWHGALEDDDARAALLADWGVARTASFAASREAQVESLAQACEEHLDVPALIDLATSPTPPRRPLIATTLKEQP